jgi:hypothetical protein
MVQLTAEGINVRPIAMRVDITPFLALQLVLLATLPFDFDYFLCVAFLIIIQLFTHLSTHWSVACRKRIMYQEAPLKLATHALLTDKYKAAIVEIPDYHTVTHCHQKYLYNEDKKAYEKQRYPISESMDFYKSTQGVTAPDFEKWSKNKM